MDFFLRALLAPVISLYLLVLRLTCRIQFHGENKALPTTPHIYACWHGRLLLTAPLWLQHKPKKMRMTMLSSAHKDGKLIATACQLIGLKVVFGSSTRGGANALRGLVRAASSGSSIFLTPDGPKGPRHHAKPGITDAARLTNLPILPIGIAARGKTLKSWDAFLAIRPFTTIHVQLGTPIPAPTSKEARDKTLTQLTQTLIQLEQAADNHVHA